MALSQDEQRELAEIERRLVADDPGLATCLTAFRRPGPAAVLRSPRARIIGSLFTVLLVAMVSVMVYAMIPFRSHLTRANVTSTAAPTSIGISATGSGAGKPKTTASAAASASGSASASARSHATTSPNKSATPGASVKPPEAGGTTAAAPASKVTEP